MPQPSAAQHSGLAKRDIVALPPAPEAAKLRKSSLMRIAPPAVLIALPATIFYGTLFRRLVNLPKQDDYDAVLAFLNGMVQAKNTGARFWLFLAWQHTDYKLFFGHAVEWAQFALLGHVDFAQLCVLGDSAVALVALILWSMFLPGETDLAKRLAYFVPVAWLLFQLEYSETLNWAMASLQNLWVLVFSLEMICCALRPSRKAYLAALVLYALAIAASGNGFLLLPVGLMILAGRRQFNEFGYTALAEEKHDRVMGMEAFEHPPTSEANEGPVLEFGDTTAAWAGFRIRARAHLVESIRLGVYEPPRL